MSEKFFCLTAMWLTLALTGSASAQLGAGNVLIEEWYTVNTGQQVNNDVTTLHNFIDAGNPPSKSYWAQKLDRPDGGEDYWGGRMRGYIIPPGTGDYTFWTCSDDDSEVWLSTDESPANATMICNVEGWLNYQDWTYGSGSPGTTYKSAAIKLQAGKKYYVDVFFSDGTGGGFDTVAWGGPGIGAGPEVVAGKYLSAFIRDPEPLFEAQKPDAADGAVDVTSPLFQWKAGVGAVMHDVYFGTNPTPGAAEYKGPMPMTMYFSLDPLTPGTTYYWRIDEVDAAGGKTTGNVWSFTVMPLTAHAPSPVNGALLKGGTPPTKLSWTPGQSVLTHDVYLGTDKAAVTAGDAGVAVAAAQAETSFTLGALEPLTTYYWRVDEHDASGTVQAGAVWSFRITDKATDTNTDNWMLGIGAAGPKFVQTYVADGVYDIGAYGGEQTYEFIVRSNPNEQEASMCLIGRRDFGDTQTGLKYEQWNNTKTYGATVFGVTDYDFKVPNAPGEYTHLAFVSSTAVKKTDLYVNGVLEGSVPTAITLSGMVGIGYGAQNRPPAVSFFDNFDGDIFGVAIYDKALSADQIAVNADKYFNPIAITDPDLLVYYDFEEGSGTIALDESGHSNHGLLMGSPQWAAGYLGGALQFNGATDYVETNFTENLAKWTISTWVTSPAAPAATAPTGPVHREKNYQLNWNHSDATFRGAAAMRVGGTWYAAKYGPVDADTWYHVAATYDGTALKAYLNGVLITTTAAPGTPDAETGTLKIGRHATAAQFFRGTVDDVRVYSRALTDVDIQRFVLADVTGPGDTIQPVPNYAGCSPAAEQVPNVIDNDATKKYLNFANSGQSAGKTVMPTGFQVTPAVGATIVTGLTLTTANDDYGRDPIAFELSGSNDGIDGPWTLIAAGDVTDFAQATTWPRFTTNATPISFKNTMPYRHYQLLFTAVRDPAAANSMQIAEVELLGEVSSPEGSGPYVSPQYPANRTVYVPTTPTFTWTPIVDAVGYDVYFGTDGSAVANADRSSPLWKGTQDSTALEPGPLKWGTTYYWRVDAINSNAEISRGTVWSFTTTNFLLTDDFSTYTATTIIDTWVPAGGATVGIEQTIVFASTKSMHLSYNRAIAPYSEAVRTFEESQDWLTGDSEYFVVYVHGKQDNAPDTLYVAIEDSLGRQAVIVHPDSTVVQRAEWVGWRIPLSDVAVQGVDLHSILKMSIGVGDRRDQGPLMDLRLSASSAEGDSGVDVGWSGTAGSNFGVLRGSVKDSTTGNIIRDPYPQFELASVDFPEVFLPDDSYVILLIQGDYTVTVTCNGFRDMTLLKHCDWDTVWDFVMLK